MEKQQFVGKNLDAALAAAAQHFATDKTLLRYKIIEVNKGNLLTKLFCRNIVIEAWIDTQTQNLQAAARAIVRQTLDKNKLRDLFEEYAKNFISAFNVAEQNFTIDIQEEEAILTITDPQVEQLLSKSDKFAFAFEHVFNRMAQHKFGEVILKASLRAGNSSEKHEEYYVSMAQKMADKVRRTGKSIIVSSKSSRERRIIHLTIYKCKGVATRSIGEGDKRKLIIYATEKSKKKEQDPSRNSGRRNEAHDDGKGSG